MMPQEKKKTTQQELEDLMFAAIGPHATVGEQHRFAIHWLCQQIDKLKEHNRGQRLGFR